MTVTGVLQWSAPGGAARFPVDDLSGWAGYVRDMVTRHPQVRQWEVWNEPPNFTADASAASYARIVRVAYDTAKALDPTVQIGLSAKATFIAWLAEAIEAGAAGHFDYVTLHPYERVRAVYDGWEEPFLSTVPQLRAMLARTSPAQADVPVQFTEVGSPAGVRAGQTPKARYSPNGQAVLLAKVMALSLAQGVERVSWYDPFDGDYSAGEAPYGLIGLDGRPRPAFTAYASLISDLGARPVYAGLVKPDPSTYVLAFGCSGRVVLVAWSGRAGAGLSLRSAATVGDVTSTRTTKAAKISLTSTPRIVTLASASDRQAWLTRAGMEQNQRSLPRTEVRWSAAGGPDGLYLLGATPTATALGRQAFRPAGSSLQVAVDQQFPSWQSGPIQVTAVVRRLSGSPGFNLKYDAANSLGSMDWAGQRGTGSWRSVTASSWQTLTWTLPDARFSGLYGFNLRLDSDSTRYSGYALAALTVRALPATNRMGS
jgi:hypothetical protein